MVIGKSFREAILESKLHLKVFLCQLNFKSQRIVKILFPFLFMFKVLQNVHS